MNIVLYPKREEWAGLLERPCREDESLEKCCGLICGEVRRDGDAALRKYAWFFDRARIDAVEVMEEEKRAAEERVPARLREAIRQAYGRVEAFHRLQLPERRVYDDGRGIRCWQEARPIGRVGLYVPGGSAPLFSTVLMLGIPARLAGCGEVVLCTPPNEAGEVNPVILWTAELCGVGRVFKAGGAQAVAAMACGTESVPRVDKIFGPGNRFVTEAKRWAARRGVAVDMPAGPSEVMVVADEGCPAAFIAADLLSQAEHGADSQVFLLCASPDLAARVAEEVERRLAGLPRRAIAEKALENSKCVVLGSIEECVEMANAYAPEHLILALRDAGEWAGRVLNAGSVFLGYYSPESAGDYASGTNHTLPTGGYARACGGLTVGAFMKEVSFQEITREGLERLGDVIETMAEGEGMEAHREAVRVRRERVSDFSGEARP